MQSDINAERIKFSCPKIVGDNLDLSQFSIRINFENISSIDSNISVKDQYICDDLSSDGDTVSFSWLIGKNAARYMGIVRFVVCAVKTDSDSNINIKWHSAIAQIPVLEGIEVEQPSFDENDKDVINQLLAITKTTSDEAVKNVNSAKEQAIKDIQNISQPDKTLTIEGGIADAGATGKAIDSLKEDLDSKIISSANLFDKSKLVSGFYTTSVSEIKISENSSYKCLLLDVIPGNTYTATGWGYTFSFYDKNGVRDTVNKVGTSTQSKENVTFTVPSNAIKMSVNLRIDTNDVDSYMIVRGDTIPSEYIPFQNTLYASPYIERNDVQKIISAKEYHVGVNQQFTSFVECMKAIQEDDSEKIVYIHEGVYDIFAELGGKEFLQTIPSDALWYDVSTIISPNTKIIGIGLVELNYLPDASLIPSDNAITCISPINVRGNVSIENITINAKNCRYCIHDEPSGLDEFNENVKKFKNVRCKKIKNDYVPISKITSGQAYAAGVNRRCSLLFEGCTFESENSIAWSAHNRSFGANDGVNITLKDCIFIGGAPSYGTVRFGNSSRYKSHSHVNIIGCYLNGKFVIQDESEGTFYNTFDVKLLNCTDVDIDTSFSTDNEYPVKVYNSITNQLKGGL